MTINNIPVGYKDSPLGIIPQEWEVKRLGEVLLIGNGKDYKHLSVGHVPVFGTGGIITYVNNYLYNGDTVCIGRKGTIDKPIFYSGKIWTVDTLFYTYAFKTTFARYIYLLFQIIDWKKYNEATGVPSLSKSTIERIMIPLPPLAEQKKIAEILSTWDKAIEKQTQLIQKLELRKKGLMQQLLTGKKRLPGFTDEWKKVKFSSLIDKISNGYTYDVNSGGNIPITRIETISKGFIDYMRVGYTQYVDTLENYRLLKGDILFSHINSIIHIGKVAIYKGEKELYHGMNLLLIRAKQTMNKNYLYYFLSSSIARKKVRSFAKQAVNQASVNTEELKKWILNIPSLQEQTAIANILSSSDEEIRLAQDKLAAMKEQKKGLMQVLLTGKKRVKI